MKGSEMERQPRKYQATAVKSVLEAYAHGVKRVLLQSPCGSGKTEMAARIIAEFGKRWLVVVHTKVLLEQMERRMRGLGLNVEVYGNAMAPAAPIVVATVQALLVNDAPKAIKPDCLCFDEAHHYEADQWSVIRDRYPEANTLGLTATPTRRDGKSLLRHFDQLVEAASYGELIKQGLLVPSQVWSPIVSEPSGLAMDPIEAWLRYSEGARTIVAVGTIAEAMDWTDRFNVALGSKGVRAECVNGKTPWTYNREVLRDFIAGKVRVLVNVYYVTEGFDLPDVGCVILARRFQFRSTYMQFVGRALRPAPGKDHASLIDLTGCARVHGVPDFDIPWDLSDNEIESSHAGPRDDDSEEDEPTTRRGPLWVSGEGLMPLYPVKFVDRNGREIAEGPPRVTVFPELVGKGGYGAARMSQLEKRAIQKAATKGPAVARRWLERERRRGIGMIDA